MLHCDMMVHRAWPTGGLDKIVARADPVVTGTSQTGRPASRWSMEQRRLRIYWLMLALDLVALTIGFYLAGQLRGARGLVINDIPILVGAIPLYLAFALVCEAYSVESLRSAPESARRSLAALGAMSLIMVTLAFFAQVGSILSRLAFTYAILLSAMLILFGRSLVAMLIRWRFGGVVIKNLLIIDGSAASAPADCDVLDINAGDGRAGGGTRPDLDSPDQLARLGALVEPYDRVFLSAADEHREAWITALKATGISVELVIPTQDIWGAVGMGRLGQADTFILSRGPLSLSSQIKKRAFDLALTIPALIFLAPLLLAVALAIRLDSEGPALFAQTRVGRGNMPFKIYKFRSMRVEQADAHGAVSARRDDDRITRVGRFIRKSSIDELPQLLNVLKGDMSLVGPRPHAMASTAGDRLFWQVSQRYWMRHAAKPGITGLAQVRGFRGNTEREEDLELRLRSDLEYVQEWSFWRDLVILFATVKVISHDNAY